MKQLVLGIVVLMPLISSAAVVDEVILNDGDAVSVKIQDCGPKTSPVLRLKKDKLIGNCVAHVKFCRAVQGYVIPDGSKASYYSYTKTPTSSSEPKLLRKVRPAHINHPAVYSDLEIELRKLIREGHCEKGIYTRGTDLGGYKTEVVVEL